MKTNYLLSFALYSFIVVFFTIKTSAQELVKNFYPGSPYYLTNVNGTLFFAAENVADTATQLWKTDGTNAGTVMITELPGGANGLGISEIVNVNGILFFSAFIKSTYKDRQLWKSDGTNAGTVLLKIPNPGNNGYLFNLTAVNNTLFFSASDPSNGQELWKSDGSPGGTTMVTDLYPGSTGGVDGTWYCNINGTLFFQGSDATHSWELYKSDGTAGGTTHIECTGVCGNNPKELINANGIVYYYAQEPNSGSGWEIWRSDGTSGGTYMIKDIYPGFGNSSITAYYGYLTNVNGIVYFKADDGVTGQELWKTDGTSSGTVKVKDISATTVGSVPKDLKNVNGTLYFNATDDILGNTVWKSDGTDAGTLMVTSAGYPTVVIGNTWYFVAGPGYGLWKSDGTAAGDQLLTTYNYPGPTNLIAVNDVLYYTVESELWKYDPLTGINSSSIESNIGIFPNPFSSLTTIKFSKEQKNTTIKIMDVSGREIKSITFCGKQLELEIEEMKAGIYFLSITSEESTYYQKLIKQ